MLYNFLISLVDQYSALNVFRYLTFRTGLSLMTSIAIVFLISSTSVFTANLGAKVSVNVNKTTLRRIFSIFLLFTCLSLIIEHYII